MFIIYMHKILLYCQIINKRQENSFVCVCTLAFTVRYCSYYIKKLFIKIIFKTKQKKQYCIKLCNNAKINNAKNKTKINYKILSLFNS